MSCGRQLGYVVVVIWGSCVALSMRMDSAPAHSMSEAVSTSDS